jgi:hypothetical protein
MIDFLWFIAVACILGGLLVIMIQLWEKIDYAKRQNRPQFIGDIDEPDPYPLNAHEWRWRQEQIQREQARRDEGWFPQ